MSESALADMATANEVYGRVEWRGGTHPGDRDMAALLQKAKRDKGLRTIRWIEVDGRVFGRMTAKYAYEATWVGIPLENKKENDDG